MTDTPATIHPVSSEPRLMNWRIIVLLAGITYYFIYFGNELLHANSVLSSITGDSLKNYYTFLYHVLYDEQFMHFGGMNHPFGEHVVYTDGIPALSFVLSFLPFTHDYLIGIFHWVLFITFMVTPLIMFEVFRLRGMSLLSSALCGFSIAILSPFFMKIFSGHYALMYNCVIALAVLLLVKYFRAPKRRTVVILAVYNTLLFFIHPYTGFSISLFCAIFLITPVTLKGRRVKAIVHTSVAALLPIIVFRGFMWFTDNVEGRSSGPAFHEGLLANASSLLVPIFGPFTGVMKAIFRNDPAGFDGLAYLGAGVIALTALLIVVLPWMRRYTRFDLTDTGLLLSALLLFVFSTGIIFHLMDAAGLSIAPLRHFRAAGRFSAFTYFALPVVVLPRLAAFTKGIAQRHHVRIVNCAAIALLLLTLWESHYMHVYARHAFWNFRNFFTQEQLTAQEKKLVATIDSLKPQAIFSLPLFLSGSEVLDKNNNNSMIPALMYSTLKGIPCMGTNLSRTAVWQAAAVANLLNPYRLHQPAAELLNDAPILVIKNGQPLDPSEKRVAARSHPIYHQDSLWVGYIYKHELLAPDTSGSRHFNASQPQAASGTNFVFIPYENRQPYLKTSASQLAPLYAVEPGAVDPGTYNVSFRFHYSALTFDAFACNMIFTKMEDGNYDWYFIDEVRSGTSLYDGFAVYEQEITIKPGVRYEFLLKGVGKESYSVSHFMLRKQSDTWISGNGRDSTVNNFPVMLQ